MQCGQDWHRRQSGAPRALQPDHQAADRRERVTVERADVDRPAGPATGTIDIQPRRSGGDGAADRWRPQRRPLCVPALDRRQRGLRSGFCGRGGLRACGQYRPRTMYLQRGPPRVHDPGFGATARYGDWLLRWPARLVGRSLVRFAWPRLPWGNEPLDLTVKEKTRAGKARASHRLFNAIPQRKGRKGDERRNGALGRWR